MATPSKENMVNGYGTLAMSAIGALTAASLLLPLNTAGPDDPPPPETSGSPPAEPDPNPDPATDPAPGPGTSPPARLPGREMIPETTPLPGTEEIVPTRPVDLPPPLTEAPPKSGLQPEVGSMPDTNVTSATPESNETPTDDLMVFDLATGLMQQGAAGLTGRLQFTTDRGFNITSYKNLPINRNHGSYTVKMFTSPYIEKFRAPLQQAIAEINSVAGMSLSLAPGTISPTTRAPRRGEIFFQVDGLGSCGSVPSGVWIGCGVPALIPHGTTGWTAVSGYVWMASSTRDYSVGGIRHVILHEIGHALGLAHYDAIFAGEYQVMGRGNARYSLGQGDISGLRHLATNNVASESLAKALYVDLLGRPIDPSAWAAFPSTLSRDGAASGVRYLLSSREYRGRFLGSLYLDALGRTIDPGGLNARLKSMGAGSSRAEQQVAVWSSWEAYARAGGSNDAWIRHLYRGLLDRAPSTSEVSGHLSAISRIGRAGVARSIIQSSDHTRVFLEETYRQMLGRSIEPGGLKTWTPFVLAGRFEDVYAAVGGSGEYRQRALARFP